MCANVVLVEDELAICDFLAGNAHLARALGSRMMVAPRVTTEAGSG